MTTSDVYFDMYDRGIYASPHETYRRLQDEAPLYWNEGYGFYLVSRHEDVGHVYGDRETYSSARGMGYDQVSSGVQMPDGMFICEDAPIHTIHRGLVSRLFTPRAVSHIEPAIEALCQEVADSVVGRERFDFVTDFAMQIPIRVIGMLVGVPEEDQPELQALFQKAMHADVADPEKQAFEGIMLTAQWFADYLDWRAEHPTDDVMTQLLNVELTDDKGVVRRLRRDEIITYLTLITSAGSDTTGTAVAWAGKLLAEHPDQRRALVDDPALIANAVEEVMRFEPPSYHACRSVTRDVEVHDQVVPAGSIMCVLQGAANRDPRYFDDPDRFDIRRTPGQIFTFGFGAHFCLGANLAKLEARLALEALLPRVPEWAVDMDAAVMTPGIHTRGWDALPVDV